ncbi:MAG: hypothetical protein KKF89_02340 [Nanoarchaeota archaeon]|nr:hypothetical protein [Nanoarchaeota archaeon]MBU1854533.1 hypothetical protein [Nanoarchaeota archaeon]
MIIWLCENCGCELKQEDKPKSCPLCQRSNATFIKLDKVNPSKEDQEIKKKYDKVLEKLEEYSKDCKSEKLEFSIN